MSTTTEIHPNDIALLKAENEAFWSLLVKPFHYRGMDRWVINLRGLDTIYTSRLEAIGEVRRQLVNEILKREKSAEKPL